MASKAKSGKTKTRLVESRTKAALRRRGAEMLGLVLIALCWLMAAVLWTYTPTDPSFFSATGDRPANALGLVGATLADPLHRAIGWAAWGLPVVFIVWGGRLLIHRGENRAVSRAILSPLAIAAAAIFASAHVPPDGWTHAYGLGGIFGDMVLASVLGLLPLDPGLALRLGTIALALLFLTTSALALGIDRREAQGFVRFLRIGLILSFAGAVSAAKIAVRAVVTLSGITARALMRGSKHAIAYQKHRAELAAAERVERAERAAVFQKTLVQRLNPDIGPDGTRAIPPIPHMADDDDDYDRRKKARGRGALDVDEDRVMSRILSAVQKRGGKVSPPLEEPDPVVGPPTDEELLRKFPLPGSAGQASTSSSPRTPHLGGVTRDGTAPSAASEPAGIDPNVALGARTGPTISPFARKSGEARVQHPDRKTPSLSTKARDEAQPQLALGEDGPQYQTPPLSLLSSPTEIIRHHLSDEALEQNARMLETVLDDYGVKGDIVSVRPGPVVTMYELEPAPGLKASRVIGLADDIARSMSALAARVSTVPGRTVIGIELPNEHREKVMLREILSAKSYGNSNHSLPLALGKDIAGEPVVANLARMPHLLIAGTTGSGKSVAINTMILSLLYKLNPDECRMIMIDPKMLELSVYDGIPHLLSPVVTDPKKAVVALKWVVAEMEERYRKMSKLGVRNIDGFNGRVREALSSGEGFTRTVQTGFDDDTGEPKFETEEYAPETMPFIVVIVDEMADLMMVAGKEIEACIQRLAQMARASGIHIIMATQRPSVDVITGTIKANFPTRISFQVTSKIDSRTILGEMGAEQLLGMGDMLFMAGGGRITRVHGPFVSDEEVEEVVGFLKAQGTPEYVEGVVDGPDGDVESEIDQVLGLGNGNGDDALYDQAVAIVLRDRKCSTSYIQRKLGIGYNKAAKLVEQMEDANIVSQANHVGKREVLVLER